MPLLLALVAQSLFRWNSSEFLLHSILFFPIYSVLFEVRDSSRLVIDMHLIVVFFAGCHLIEHRNFRL